MLKVFKTTIEVVTATYVGFVIVGIIYELGKDAGRKEALEEIEENKNYYTTFNNRHYVYI